MDHNYENAYPSRPSVEINAALKVLAKGEDNPFDSAKIDLMKANLTGAGLEGANLYRARLREVDFTEAHMSGANLSETYLYKANLFKANLNRVDLSGANLQETTLMRAQLIKANLRGTFLHIADLTGANLYGANLRKADLTEVSFSGVNLIETQLIGANLGGAALYDAVRLTRDKNKWANFAGCEFNSKFGNQTSFKDMYWGVLTQGLEDAIEKDRATFKRDNENRYLAENAVRRELTQGEKEYLVGKDNVDKCEWGTIRVLEG